MRSSRRVLLSLCLLSSLYPGGKSAQAGPVNPNISVIGEPSLGVTTDRDVTDGRHPRFDLGETEIAVDAYLNPFATGLFTFSFGESGAEVEEGYFTVQRGLPLGVALRGGKYRVGFGKLNPLHPHATPFIERFGVLAAYLPGDESLNETGVEVTRLFPLVGDAAVTASADLLQGDTFRIERAASEDPSDPLNASADRAAHSRPAVLARLSTFFMLGEQSAMEIGASAIGGTNNVAARTRTTVLGADFKAKLWRNPRSYVVVQGEALDLIRENASWSDAAGYGHSTARPAGGYIFADYYFTPRYDAGLSYESFQEPTAGRPRSSGIGAYAGYSVMEESLVFRGGWSQTRPAQTDRFDTFRVWVIYSMGPHKAHQF
jgi:hypothetical protein